MVSNTNGLQSGDMDSKTRKAVIEYADENGYPMPGQVYKAIYNALVIQYRLSLIMKEIDTTIDRITLLNERIELSVEEGNLTALVMLKDRKTEELAKLKAYERLLDRESPMAKKVENGVTDEMINNAKQYPMEELLASYGCQVKMHRCRCPVHEGKNSTSFEVKNGMGRCHSCGWFGDQIELVRKIEGVTFIQAVRRLQ
ncbi:MAG: CHC2 zinc finger domain-containing protein [Syntrophaceae bacterium]